MGGRGPPRSIDHPAWVVFVPYRFFRHLRILRIALMTTNTIGVGCAIGDSGSPTYAWRQHDTPAGIGSGAHDWRGRWVPVASEAGHKLDALKQKLDALNRRRR